MNLHDAEITSLYVSEEGAVAGIEDDAPNFPGGGKFRVNLVMVAGGAVAGSYDLVTTCTDVTDCTPVPALNPAPGGPLNGPGAFVGPRWVANPPQTDKVFNHSVWRSW